MLRVDDTPRHRVPAGVPNASAKLRPTSAPTTTTPSPPCRRAFPPSASARR